MNTKEKHEIHENYRAKQAKITEHLTSCRYLLERFAAEIHQISPLLSNLINDAHRLIHEGDDNHLIAIDNAPDMPPPVSDCGPFFSPALVATIKTIRTIATQALEVYEREPQLYADAAAVEIEGHIREIVSACEEFLRISEPTPGMIFEILPDYTLKKIFGRTVDKIQKNASKARRLYETHLWQAHDPASVTVDALVTEINGICTELLERVSE